MALDRIVRVDMSRREVRSEKVPDAWARLGGRALASAIVAAEVPPACRPLGPENKLVFAPGLLAGTAAACSSRLSIAAKSPLTGTLRASNAGGGIAARLVGLGIRALIVEGAATDNGWYGLHIGDDGVSVRREMSLAGLGIAATFAAVEARRGSVCGMLAIGPGGEMEMAAANVSLKDPAAPVRKVGRGGLGAVFGAKRIKLITFDGGGTLPAAPLADRAGFTDALRRFAAALTDCPPGRRVPAYGAGLFTAILDQDAGNGRDDSPDVALSRDDGFKPGCRPECLIPGSRVLHGSGGHYLSAVPGVVGDWARGAGCCVDDPADVAAADRLMDDIGLDSIETGVMFGLAMEAGLLPVGDGKGVIRLLTEEIAKGTAFGRMLGGGTATLRRIYPQAGCTADSANDVSESSPDRRAATAVADSVGMCLFVAVPALDIPACATALRDMIGARFGDGLSADDWTALGRRVLDIETRFNRAAGVTEENDGRLDIFHRMPAVQRETGWSGGGAGIDTFWDF